MDASSVLRRRLQASYRMIALLLPFLMLNVLALMLMYRDIAGMDWWLLSLALTGSVWAGLGWWGRRPLRQRALAVWAFGLVAGALALALEYSWFLMHLAAVLNGDQALALAVQATVLAVVGIFALSSYPMASLAWTVGFSPALVATAGLDVRWQSLEGSLVVTTLGGALVVLVWMARNGLVSRLKAESQAATQGQLVGLLMHGESAQNWTWETDVAGRFRAVTPRMARQFSRSVEALEGRTWAEVVVDEDSDLTIEDEEQLQTLDSVLAEFQTFHDLEVPAPAVGTDRRWRVSGRPILDDLGTPVGWRGVGTDITEADRIATQNQRLAIIDDLTGLINRRKLQEVLHDQLSPRSGDASFSLVLIDLRGFRSVNEALGHDVGDHLLRQVARRLLPLVPSGGLLARLGGDEFALLAPGAEERALARLTEALQTSSNQPFLIEGHRLEVTYQLGCASTPRDARGATELLKSAELALHEAQTTGQKVVVYQNDLGKQALDRIRLHRELKVALPEAQFELHYQPQLRVRDGTLMGAEALVRWRHPLRGLVSPAEFIPALEETGMIVEVGAWILQQACREALSWPDGERVAVNVSAVQFASRTFLETVREVLSSTGLAPRRLELEITESVMAQEPGQVVSTLNELRAIGIGIALDDFGTGYSSLSYLRQLPLDSLKIDQSFVRALSDDPNAVAIVQTVLDLSRALGLGTTAEGVETEEQRARLASLGADNVQGYLFSRPVSAEGLAAFRAALRSR